MNTQEKDMNLIGPVAPYAGGTLFAVGVFVAFLIPLHDREEIETYYTEEVLTYSESSVQDTQVRRFCFPWFCERTEVEYGLQNTGEVAGDFIVHFQFHNDSESATESATLNVGPGEVGIAKSVSPFEGRSEYTIGVEPPVVRIPHQRTVTRRVNTFRLLYDSLPHRLGR